MGLLPLALVAYRPVLRFLAEGVHNLTPPESIAYTYELASEVTKKANRQFHARVTVKLYVIDSLSIVNLSRK
jgi:hypothetical protein